MNVFAGERDRLAAKVGAAALEIEHVGSTAVPDLMSKPIVDIAVGVSSLDDSVSWPEILRSEGYAFFGDREGRGEHFYAKGPEQMRTIYLHVVPIRSSRWADYLRFRDALRNSASLRKEYETLKCRLQVENEHDRLAYTEGKAAFIAKVLMPKLSPDLTTAPGTPPAGREALRG
jgi:GrpB-like predicted nucleotidyltransferase (UPF0157 family)